MTLTGANWTVNSNSVTKISALAAFKDNYIWLLEDRQSKHFDCVDPGDAAPVIKYARQSGKKLRSVMLTHHHYDHSGGVEDLTDFFQDLIVYGPVDSRIKGITAPVNAEQNITQGNSKFQILSTPGHTATHISYFEPEKKWLFCGDTLFSAGCGRVFDGSIQALYYSLQRLSHLPDNTLVFCAHEYTLTNLKFAATIEPHNVSVRNYLKKILGQANCRTLPSTIGLEKKINPFFRTKKTEIKEFAKKHQINPDDPLAVFSFLRAEKDNFNG